MSSAWIITAEGQVHVTRVSIGWMLTLLNLIHE